MIYTEAEIKTGDVLLVDGTGLVSDIIEVVTEGRFSHVAVFFWEDGELKLAEEWQGTGYEDNLAAKRLPEIEGKLFLGTAPPEVRQNPIGVLSKIADYRTCVNLRPYGYFTLFGVAAADNLGLRVDPSSVQAVCSVFVQQCWESCGCRFTSIASPSDFDRFCSEIIPIEV